jgi:hypothetical protein
MNFQNILFVTAISLAASLVQAGDKGHQLRADVNGDGVISRAEMIEHRQQSFTRMDLNGDSYMTREEIAEFKAKMRAARETKEQDRFDRADSNKDGKVSSAEFSESTALMAQRLDSDGDGNISRAEMRKGMREHHGHGPDATK